MQNACTTSFTHHWRPRPALVVAWLLVFFLTDTQSLLGLLRTASTTPNDAASAWRTAVRVGAGGRVGISPLGRLLSLRGGSEDVREDAEDTRAEQALDGGGEGGSGPSSPIGRRGGSLQLSVGPDGELVDAGRMEGTGRGRGGARGGSRGGARGGARGAGDAARGGDEQKSCGLSGGRGGGAAAAAKMVWLSSRGASSSAVIGEGGELCSAQGVPVAGSGMVGRGGRGKGRRGGVRGRGKTEMHTGYGENTGGGQTAAVRRPSGETPTHPPAPTRTAEKEVESWRKKGHTELSAHLITGLRQGGLSCIICMG